MSVRTFIRSALATAVVSFISASAANATVIAYGQPGFPAVTVSPNSFVEAYYSDSSNADVGNQSPANVQSVLQGWFGGALSFVGGGSCGASPTYTNNCTAYDNGGGNSNKGGISNLTAQIFAVHFGNRFIAFLYPGPVSGFQIDGLRFGVSNIYAFNGTPEIPVPGALWLMGSALVGLGFARRRRNSA
jgi:hypothetical protein